MAREASSATLIAAGQVDRLLKNMVFPDYSKLLATSMPDFSKLAMASLPDTSKLVAASLPDVSKLAAASLPDMSKLAAMKIPDYPKLITGLDTGKLLGDYSRTLGAAAMPASIMSSISLRSAFPDYSKVFSGLNNLSVFQQYQKALPAATKAAESLVVSEVLREGAPPASGQDVWEWIAALSPQKKRQLGQRVVPAIGLIVGLAGAALDQKYVQIAGMLLALASAVYALYLFIKEEIEAQRDFKN